MHTVKTICIITSLVLVGGGCNTKASVRSAYLTTPTNTPQKTELISRTYFGIVGNKNVTAVLKNTAGIIEGSYHYAENRNTFELSGSLEGDVVSLGEFSANSNTTDSPSAEFRLNVGTAGELVGNRISKIDNKTNSVRLYETDNTLTEQQQYGGHYELAEYPEQYIDVLFLSPQTVKLQAHAQWQGLEPQNIHFGDVTSILPWTKNSLVYRNEVDGCELNLNFDNAAVKGTDNGECGGVNVRFNGTYKRTSTSVPNWSVFNEQYTENGI